MIIVSLSHYLSTTLINTLSPDKAEVWTMEHLNLLHPSLSTLIGSVHLSFKATAANLVPYAFSLHPQLSVSTSAATQHTMEIIRELLSDFNFFLVNHNSIRLPAHPALITIILQTIFQSHGGKLQSWVDFTHLETIFALSGVAIYSILLKYQTGIHHPTEFGVEFHTKFNECKQKLDDIRGNLVAREELSRLQSDLITRGKCM